MFFVCALFLPFVIWFSFKCLLFPLLRYWLYSLQASLRERYGVDITPLTYIPGGRIDKYLGNLNFFFIRESTSIRENGGISGFVHNFITEVKKKLRCQWRSTVSLFNFVCYFIEIYALF